MGDLPVTAPKSFFGDLGAGSGAVEMAASVLSFEKGLVPFTRNYRRADPECPVNVIRDEPKPLTGRFALVTNHTRIVQAISMILAAP